MSDSLNFLDTVSDEGLRLDVEELESLETMVRRALASLFFNHTEICVSVTVPAERTAAYNSGVALVKPESKSGQSGTFCA